MPILREDKDLKNALQSCRTICVVGISPDPYKPSYFVSDVLQSHGFKLCFVNPNYADRVIWVRRFMPPSTMFRTRSTSWMSSAGPRRAGSGRGGQEERLQGLLDAAGSGKPRGHKAAG